MKDYTKEIQFWERLQSFVSDVETSCAMGEEEKNMILHQCKFKLNKGYELSPEKLIRCTRCDNRLTSHPSQLCYPCRIITNPAWP